MVVQDRQDLLLAGPFPRTPMANEVGRGRPLKLDDLGLVRDARDGLELALCSRAMCELGRAANDDALPRAGVP